MSIRNFRLYFIGQAISLSGTWMQMIGQDWLVLKLTNSGTTLGIVTALQFLPILLLGALAGVIADRFPKRTLLYITQISAGIVALVLGILVATNTIQLWMLYILATLLGFINLVDNPARQTFVFEMVGKDSLQNAITLNSTEVNLARVVGPSIAGVIIAVLGLAPCFLLNAASYIPVLIVLAMMDKKELFPSNRVAQVKGQLSEGFSYIKSTPVLLHTLVMMAIIGTFSYEFTVVLPLLAKYTFSGNAGTYASLTAAMGIGSVIGGLIAAGRGQTSPRKLITIAFLFGLSMIITAVISVLSLEIIMLAIVGVFSINFISLGNTILQLESAPEMRGRVMSLWAVAFLGSTPIGGPIIGWIAERTNPQWGLITGGIAAIFAAAYGFTIVTLNKRKRLLISEHVELDNLSNISQDGSRL